MQILCVYYYYFPCFWYLKNITQLLKIVILDRYKFYFLQYISVLVIFKKCINEKNSVVKNIKHIYFNNSKCSSFASWHFLKCISSFNDHVKHILSYISENRSDYCSIYHTFSIHDLMKSFWGSEIGHIAKLWDSLKKMDKSSYIALGAWTSSILAYVEWLRALQWNQMSLNIV